MRSRDAGGAGPKPSTLRTVRVLRLVDGRRYGSLNVATLQGRNPIVGHTWLRRGCGDPRAFEFDNLRSLGKEIPRMEKNHPLFGAIKSLPTRILRENVQQVLVQLGW